MKVLFVLFFGLLTTFSVTAQDVAEVKPEKEYKATMDGWLVDIDEAYERSVKEGKPILANFTGSDWCGWCIRLKSEVFTTKEFKKWAKANVILLELDFPRRFKLPENIQQQNQGLAQAFSVSGYPTVWIFNLEVDPEANKSNIVPLARSGYVKGGPEAWIADIKAKLAQQ